MKENCFSSSEEQIKCNLGNLVSFFFSLNTSCVFSQVFSSLDSLVSVADKNAFLHTFICEITLQVCVCACMSTHVLTQSCVRTIAHQAPPWNFPGKNTGVSYHFLLQGLNLHLCVSCMSRQILYHCATWHPCMHIPYAYKMNKEQRTSLGAECGTYKEMKEGRQLLSATDLQFKR